MSATRRRWLQAATMWPACRALLAARNPFWEIQDPANWSNDEKRLLLNQSPWAREGIVRMETDKNRAAPPPPSEKIERPGGDVPDSRPGVQPGGVKSYPIGGEPPPRPPNPDPGHPVQFAVLARWETAKPVRLAGGPEVPEMTGQFYVIRLRGLPLMPPSKPKPDEAAPQEAAPNPNEWLLQAIKTGSRLERKDKPAIPCAHLFTGSGDAANEVLLFFPKGSNPITIADKVVTLECRFTPFYLSVKFPVKEMMYKGQLAL